MKKEGQKSGPLQPALLRNGRDSVELREGADPARQAGLLQE